MKVEYTILNGKLKVQVEASTVREVWKELANIDEVFNVDKCGACGGNDLKFVVRTVDENDYYEIKCQNTKCLCRLQFGANKKGGGLFPKRKDAEGKTIGKYGWAKWEGKKEE